VVVVTNVHLIPGQIAVEATASARVNLINQTAAGAPGGLYPLHSRTFVLDEYRLLSGWPVPVPPYDIRATVNISAVGEVVSYREDPTAYQTGAVFRWVADSQFVDPSTLEWKSFQGHLSFQTSVEFSPVLMDDYEYRIKSERFHRTVLNFDSDEKSHMWLDLGPTLGGAAGYTLLFVMSPLSAYGNNSDVPYNGLWCPGRPTGVPDGGGDVDETQEPHWFSITQMGQYLYHETEEVSNIRTVPISPELQSSAPMYLAVVVGRPTTTFYAGSGPANLRTANVRAGTNAVPLHDFVVLGRSHGDVNHTMDMALFEVGIYANQLTPLEVISEVATLARTYGGDDG
jgi:hypothetical protein